MVVDKIWLVLWSKVSLAYLQNLISVKIVITRFGTQRHIV